MQAAPAPTTAFDEYAIASHRARLSWGCPQVDAATNGGVRVGSITEVNCHKLTVEGTIYWISHVNVTNVL